MDLEKLIAEMREQGADDDQILQSLAKMVEEGKISEEEYAHAKGLLHAGEDIEEDEDEDKKKASELFGLKLM